MTRSIRPNTFGYLKSKKSFNKPSVDWILSFDTRIYGKITAMLKLLLSLSFLS